MEERTMRDDEREKEKEGEFREQRKREGVGEVR
jgi:hypothetical protein